MTAEPPHAIDIHRTAKEHSRLIAMLEREAFDHDSPEARFYLADHYLRAGDYRRAAGLVYSVRNERRATEILLECFRRCPSGELDDLKWVDQPQPESPHQRKCLAADVNDLGGNSPGACGLKCTDQWDVGDGRESDYYCDWQGNWTLCPKYRAPHS